MKLDECDRRLLLALQKDAQATSQDLSEHLGLSASQISRRRQRLEATGYIKSYVARLCPQTLGLGVQAFIQVQMASQQPKDARSFLSLLSTRPEVVSAWTLTGEADYLLRVYADDLAALNSLLHDVLLPHPGVSRVQSQIVMDQPKADTGLPI